MSDELDVLRHDHDVIEPDPQFRAELMDRLRHDMASGSDLAPSALSPSSVAPDPTPRDNLPSPARIGDDNALERRLEAVVAAATGGDPAIDDRELLDLSLPATRPSRRRWVGRTVLGAAAAFVLVAVGVVIRREEPVSIESATAPIVTPRPNGWVAQNFSSVYLLREGGDDRLVDLPGAVACPAFSPDGARLMVGTSTDGDAASRVVTVAADGTVSPLTTIPLDGVEGIPCAIWSPDGRWAALGGDGAVWVVDTETAEVRRLPGYEPRDLEWRPGTDELAITGRAVPGSFVGENAPIDIYRVSTGKVRTIDDVEAAELTWSPDGTTLAYTQAVAGAEDTKSGITLIDADGSSPRPLTTDEYVADHGIGVTWSPRGDQIAYQRERIDCTGNACYERSEVVLVTATSTDADTPIGTERVIPPVVDNLDTTNFGDVFDHSPPFSAAPWYANSVTWSPDGTQLLYSAGSAGLITVPADGAHPAIVRSGDLLIGVSDEDATSPWLPLQQWQPAP